MRTLVLLMLLTACGGNQPARQFDCTERLAAANAQFPDNAALDEWVDGAGNDRPGLVVAIRDAKLGTWVGTRGFADFETKTPMRSCHRYEIGSTTKIFVAVLAMQLIEGGLLRLDDRAADYLPPAVIRDIRNADRATIRQLLNHTSGIFNYTAGAKFTLSLMNDPSKIRGEREALDYARGTDASFEPGTKWEYSNTNFALLGRVVEEVTSETLARRLEERIFRPLGMSHTTFSNLGDQRANGYLMLHADTTFTAVGDFGSFQNEAAGGIISSVDDILLFLEALEANTLISADSHRLMQQWVPIPSQDEGDDVSQYGLGLMRTGLRSQTPRWVGHSGNTVGFSSTAARSEGSGRLIVAFTNLGAPITSNQKYYFGDLFSAGVQSGALH